MSILLIIRIVIFVTFILLVAHAIVAIIFYSKLDHRVTKLEQLRRIEPTDTNNSTS